MYSQKQDRTICREPFSPNPMNKAEFFSRLADIEGDYRERTRGQQRIEYDSILLALFKEHKVPDVPLIRAAIHNGGDSKIRFIATLEKAWLAYRTLFYAHLLPIARKVFPPAFGGGTKNLTAELRAEAGEEGAAVLELLSSFQQLQLMMLMEGIALPPVAK